GGYDPTGVGRRREGVVGAAPEGAPPSKFAWSGERAGPKGDAPGEAAWARQGCSHSASVGSRYLRGGGGSSGSAGSFAAKSRASAKVTFSTAWLRVSSPATAAKWLGDLPVT